MSAFNRTQQDLDWPKGDDPSITAKLAQAGFRVLLTLAGAAAGWYLVASGGQTVLYLGPLVGISAWYGWLGPLWRAARHHGATQWELVEHRPAPPENDGQIWSE